MKRRKETLLHKACESTAHVAGFGLHLEGLRSLQATQKEVGVGRYGPCPQFIEFLPCPHKCAIGTLAGVAGIIPAANVSSGRRTQETLLTAIGPDLRRAFLPAPAVGVLQERSPAKRIPNLSGTGKP